MYCQSFALLNLKIWTLSCFFTSILNISIIQWTQNCKWSWTSTAETKTIISYVLHLILLLIHHKSSLIFIKTTFDDRELKPCISTLVDRSFMLLQPTFCNISLPFASAYLAEILWNLTLSSAALHSPVLENFFSCFPKDTIVCVLFRIIHTILDFYFCPFRIPKRASLPKRWWLFQCLWKQWLLWERLVSFAR